jgi:pSer/pThr/pTyr-binding forkhead associated (FHA) protein
MPDEVNGELVPLGGGDTIPLLRPVMTVGRRESCDVPLQFPNISGMHCELTFKDGYWSVRDLNSTNGTKVNGLRVQARPLKPGDEISIGKRRFTIQYTLSPQAQQELETLLAEDENVFGKSLLERAGLANPNPPAPRRPVPPRPRPLFNPRIELTDMDED